MKKTTTSNPLKFFNDAKEARNKSFSKSLPKKGDGGRAMGPMTQQEAAAETAATSYSNNIPYANPKPIMSNSRPTMMDPREALKKANRPPLNIPSVDTPQPTYLEPKISNMQRENVQKKGGTHKMPNGKVMLNSKMKTGGVVKKKFDDGGLTGKQNRLARQEKRVYNKYTDAKTSGNTKKSSRLYDRLMDKQTKSIKAGVNVQYKTGGTTKATKFAALAPPYNKATAADRIAGAKKNARKKK